MARKGFRDLRTPDELADVPGPPASKLFLRNLTNTSFIAGAFQAAASLAGALFGSLGVALTENGQQSRNPRRPDEPTTSRLARGVVAGTLVREKLQNRLTSVRIGTGTPGFFGQFLNSSALAAAQQYSPLIDKLFTTRKSSDGAWSEPPTPYAAKYPYNQVQETESGHVVELDDTPGAERVHVAHRSGTFVEMHPDGTSVDKVVKDRYTITMGDDYVSVTGNCHVNVQGNVTLYVQGNLDAQVMGGAAITAKENLKLFSKNVEINAQKSVKLNAPVIDLYYLQLPSCFKGVPSQPAFSIGGTTLNPAPIKARTVVVPTASKLTYDDDAGSIQGLSDAMPSVEPPSEIPLSNPTLYQDTTPQAVDQRARLFDSPSETQNMDAYTSHMQLSLALNDFAIEHKRIAGVFSGIDTTLPTSEPSILTGDFSTYQGTYAYNVVHSLSTFYTLRDLLPTDTRFAVTSTQANLQPQNGLLQDQLVYNLSNLSTNVLDPVRTQYPDVVVVEGLRDVHTGQSQHETGEAVDIRFPNLAADVLLSRAQWIRDNIAYDELVLNWTNVGDEPWLHISYTATQRRRVVYTKDFMDNFYDGLRVVQDYASDTDRLAAVAAANAQAATLSATLTTASARSHLLTPVTAADSGVDGGVKASDGTVVRGYQPQWNGSSVDIKARVGELATLHPTDFANVAAGNTAFITTVVADLTAQGYPCALNGFHGSLTAIAPDSIAFFNATGVNDASGRYTGLEIYQVVADGAATCLDLTPDLLVAGYIGAWVDPA